jgi:putative acetyltransferase
MNSPIIRPFQSSDIIFLIQLFKDAVNTINIKDYSKEQIVIWANSTDWQNHLEKNITLVAEINHIIVGFADITHHGYLNHFYIHKDYLGAKGNWIALKLFKAIELKARGIGLSEITTYCSITAKKPAERMGFVILHQNIAIKDNETFINYAMKKILK